MVKGKGDSQAAAIADQVTAFRPSPLGIPFLVVGHGAAVLGRFHATPDRNLEGQIQVGPQDEMRAAYAHK